jgi:cell division protein ZapA
MTTSNKKIHDVKVAGVPLRIRSTHDQETVQELVRMVDEKINEALRLTPSGSFQHGILLAALNMAEELLVLRQKAQTELTRLEHKAKSIIVELESSAAATN